MARKSLLVLIKVVGKWILATNVVILLFINYKWSVLHGNHYNQSTTSDNATRHFIPLCFRNIHELEKNSSDTRWRLEIKCNFSKADVTKQKVDKKEAVFLLTWKDNLECLKTFIKQHCYTDTGQGVPNIIHYVWFGHPAFKAENFVSVLSIVRFQQPCCILFHARDPPFGLYWMLLLSIVPNIIHVQREEPSNIYGRKFGFIQHKADIVRMEVLYELGGIYMDNDQMLVRDVHELLNETFVMSHENKDNLANSMILARPRAEFINIWHNEYKWYNPKKWGYHSTYIPWILAKKNSHLIKVVGNRFVNPDLTDILKVFNSHYNLSTNYGLHLYTRFYPKIQLDLPEVTTRNTSLGEVWRTILYNSSAMFTCPNATR